MKLKGVVSVTLLALGGLAGAAISSNAESSSPEATAALKPKVRTEVVRRTIHRTKVAKPEKVAGSPVQSASAAVAPAPVASSYASTPSYTPAASNSASSETAVTSSSGSAGSGGSYESDDSQESETGHEAEESHGGGDD